MAEDRTKLPTAPPSAEVDGFVQKLRATPVVRESRRRGRLAFAMHATASRAPTWDRACQIQGEMFTETAALGGLEIQLVFYRGYRECKSSSWLTSSAELLRRMLSVSCLGG